MSKPLLLGESPSRAGDRYYSFPLSGAPAERLLRFAGIEREREPDAVIETLGLTGPRQFVAAYWTLTDHFDTLNVVERWPGEEWPHEAARQRWCEYVAEEGLPEVLVCVGQRSAEAVGLGLWDWFKWHDVSMNAGVTRAVKIPHPSGRNRLYNDEDNRGHAGEVLREAIEWAEKA